MEALPISDDPGMSAYNSKFYDGFFLIRALQVIVFLRTDGNEAFTLAL